MDKPEDVEGQRVTKIPFVKMVLDQGVLTPEIFHHPYQGSGTEQDPYIVVWIENDPRNPMNFSAFAKWWMVALVGITSLAVTFASSAYTGGSKSMVEEFHTSQEVVVLGVSFFVLGFAIGPLFWAPISELFGRQYLLLITYGLLTVFNLAAIGAKDMPTLIVLRFFAGAFGSSPLTNAGGIIADMFTANERGLASTIFAPTPFMGPMLGPIIGGFVGESAGWRWIEGIMALISGITWFMTLFFLPETYAPVVLRKRAQKLSSITGKVYVSKVDHDQGKVTLGQAFRTALSRPWVLLFKEPIVLFLSIYLAVIYGTLYMMFAAYPIVYQHERGWSPGVGGLPFLGTTFGVLLAVAYSLWDNRRYVEIAAKDPEGYAPPEARLPPCIVGGIAIPIGLFWFAWSNGPNTHWIASVGAGIPFGFGMCLVFLAVISYLIDSYVIFAASVIAANTILRSIFGAVFPLFTPTMYANLGIHWASTIPGFLAIACIPYPFLFYQYGSAIRAKCAFAAQAEAFLKKMRMDMAPPAAAPVVPPITLREATEGSDSSKTVTEVAVAEVTPSHPRPNRSIRQEGGGNHSELDEPAHLEALDSVYDMEEMQKGRFYRMKTPAGPQQSSDIQRNHSVRSTSQISYEGNPYDIDRLNTRGSFRRQRRRRRDSPPAPRRLRRQKSWETVSDSD